MQNNTPNIALQKQLISKTKAIIIFRRKKISYSDFKKTEAGFIFEEKFIHNGVNGFVRLNVNSNRLYDVLQFNSKTARIEDDGGRLNLSLQFDDQEKLPLDRTGTIGCVKYELQCEAGELYCFRNYGNKKKRKKALAYHSGRTPLKIPSTVMWAASRPLQGGGFNPR